MTYGTPGKPGKGTAGYRAVAIERAHTRQSICLHKPDSWPDRAARLALILFAVHAEKSLSISAPHRTAQRVESVANPVHPGEAVRGIAEQVRHPCRTLLFMGPVRKG